MDRIDPGAVVDFQRLGQGMFLRGLLPFYVLRLLADGPQHGAEIASAIRRMTRGAWAPSPGALYPLLHRLRDLGAVTETEATSGRRLVRQYALTPEGAAVYEELRASLRSRIEASMDLLRLHLENL